MIHDKPILKIIYIYIYIYIKKNKQNYNKLYKLNDHEGKWYFRSEVEMENGMDA